MISKSNMIHRYFWIAMFLAAFGLVVTWHQRRNLWPIYFMIAAYAASLLIFYILARYRYPLVPMLDAAAYHPRSSRSRCCPATASCCLR